MIKKLGLALLLITGLVTSSFATTPIYANRVVFPNKPVTIIVGTCGEVDVVTEGSNLKPEPVQVDKLVTVSSNRMSVYADSACKTLNTKFTIKAGDQIGKFYLKGTTIGNWQISISAPGFNAASQTESIIAAPPPPAPPCTGIQSAPTTSPSQASAAGFNNLIADDEFNDASKIGTLWYTTNFFSTTYNLPAPPIGYTIQNGCLTINTDKSGFSYGLATIDPTHQTNIYQFGYFEARAKFSPISESSAGGDWPAFWLGSLEGLNGAKQFSEMDIMEMYRCRGTGLPGCYITTIHEWTNGYSSQNQNTNNFPTFNPIPDFNQYHIYGFLWTPTQAQWYFDNNLITTVPIGSGTNYPSAITNHMTIILGTADKGQPITVDWVHVWR